MNPIVPITVGGMIATGGVVFLALQLRPSPPQLAGALGQLVATPEVSAPASTIAPGRAGQFGSRLLPESLIKLAGRYIGVSDKDLEILQLDRSTVTGRSVLLGFLFLLVPALGTEVVSLTGHHVSTLPALFALFAAVFGFLIPGTLVKSRAARARTQMREVLPEFATWVVLRRSSGAAPEEAVIEAGRGWRSPQVEVLYTTVLEATAGNKTPWEALGALGKRLDISQLQDFGDVMAAAGDGAAVVASLQAAVRNLRHTNLTKDKEIAKKKTEQLAHPAMLMLAAYVLMLFIPPMIRLFQFQ